MPEYSTLSSKGQLVIPKKIREAANFQPGDQLELTWQGERLEIRKIRKTAAKPEPSLVRELLGKYAATDEREREEENARLRALREHLYGKIDS
ncbi:MAG TPA: AbrB/MazE/SpoVT family DNA-binding domain-containing protein [Bacilli bacterium]